MVKMSRNVVESATFGVMPIWISFMDLSLVS